MPAPAVLLLLLLAACAAVQAAKPPHIVFALIDDWGWSNWAYHSPNNTEVVTPNLNALAADGIVLVSSATLAARFVTVTRRAAQRRGAQRSRPRS